MLYGHAGCGVFVNDYNLSLEESVTAFVGTMQCSFACGLYSLTNTDDGNMTMFQLTDGSGTVVKQVTNAGGTVANANEALRRQ
jgi:hypothetical protein